VRTFRPVKHRFEYLAKIDVPLPLLGTQAPSYRVVTTCRFDHASSSSIKAGDRARCRVGKAVSNMR